MIIKTIEVTMEKLLRIAHQFEVTDEVFDEICRTQRIPDDMFTKMEEIFDDTASDTEYDYAVVDADNPDVNIIDWER